MKSLEDKTQKLSFPALKKLAKPEGFVIIRGNKRATQNVYAKVYGNSCKLVSLVEDGQNSIPLNELVNEEWYGCCHTLNDYSLEQAKPSLSSRGLVV